MSGGATQPTEKPETMTQVIINDVALAELAGAIDGGAVFGSPETAAFAVTHQVLIEQLRHALTTRCVQFANRAAESDNPTWRVAMAVLVGELLSTASVMAGSLASASGERFSPAKLGWSAYLEGASQRPWWDKPEATPGQIVDHWAKAFEVGQRADGAPASAGDVIDASMRDVGLDPVATPLDLGEGARIPMLPPGDQLCELDLDGVARPLGSRDRAEIQYWREHQACELEELLRALDQRAAPKAFLIRRLANAYSGLKDALAGELYERCEGCGRQIWPGEIEIPFTDVRCHADCSGAEGIKAGDQVKVNPESLEQEDGEPPRDYVIAFAAAPLFTAEQIRERVLRAHEVLVQAGRI
jgi:hypothetical protein